MGVVEDFAKALESDQDSRGMGYLLGLAGVLKYEGMREHAIERLIECADVWQNYLDNKYKEFLNG